MGVITLRRISDVKTSIITLAVSVPRSFTHFNPFHLNLGHHLLRAEQRAKAALGVALPERKGGVVWAGGEGGLLGFALGYSGPDTLDKHLMCTDRWG